MKEFKIEPDLSYSGHPEYTLYFREIRGKSWWNWRPWSTRWENIYEGSLQSCEERVQHLSQPTVYP